MGSMKGPVQQTTITGVVRQTPVALYQTPCQKGTVSPMKVNMDNAAAVASVRVESIGWPPPPIDTWCSTAQVRATGRPPVPNRTRPVTTIRCA